MERRLFVGSAAVVSLGASAGLSAMTPKIDLQKFEEIQIRELGKLEDDMKSMLIARECPTCHVSSFLTPVRVVKRSLRRDKFYLKYMNANNEIISITRDKGKTIMKLGKEFA